MGRKLGLGVVLVVCAWALAQTGGKTENTAAPASFSGKQLYESNCATCHGTDGKGAGPFVAQLKVPPPDLTQLAKNNHDVFPQMRVVEVIDGEFAKPPHGSAEMPIWGPVFRSMAHGRKDSAAVRMEAVAKYLESLQER